MVVEPESLCWLTGRMVKARDGVTWAEEFARFPALKAVVRDDGTGLGNGVKLERARRRAADLPDLDETLDVFPTSTVRDATNPQLVSLCQAAYDVADRCGWPHTSGRSAIPRSGAALA